MLIKEVCEECKLTKKAIAYYERQGLVSPSFYENGYRDYSQQDIAILKEISVLRKLDISIPNIKNIMSSKNKSATLSKCKYIKNLEIEKVKLQRKYLDKLISNYDIEKIHDEMDNCLDDLFTIKEKLAQAFPGSYGIYISIHFGQFLDSNIDTKEQNVAYKNIISYLDSVNDLEFSPELESYMEEAFSNANQLAMHSMVSKINESLSDVDNFIDDNKEMLEEYLEYRMSDEYKQSIDIKMRDLILNFQKNSGYYDVFLANFKILSPSYKQYVDKLNQANEVFLKRFPQIKEILE